MQFKNRKVILAIIVLIVLFFAVGLMVGRAITSNIVLDDTSIFEGNLTVEGLFTAGNYKVGYMEDCYNGTWFHHGLSGDPATAGSISLSLRGPSAYNDTFILRVPTVLQSNSTHI